MSYLYTEGTGVYDDTGTFIGTVDRSLVGDHDDSQIIVTLACGHQERFWDTRHSNEEYIRRTIHLKELSINN